MVRYLILAVVLGFVVLAVIAGVRALLQGPRDERERRERD